MPPSWANAFSGHATTTSSASGQGSRVAKRPRGSTTNGRQPAAEAMLHSAAAKSTAPNTISRGGGATTSTNRSPRSSLRSAHISSSPYSTPRASSSGDPSEPDASPSARTSSFDPSTG